MAVTELHAAQSVPNSGYLRCEPARTADHRWRRIIKEMVDDMLAGITLLEKQRILHILVIFQSLIHASRIISNHQFNVRRG